MPRQGRRQLVHATLVCQESEFPAEISTAQRGLRSRRGPRSFPGAAELEEDRPVLRNTP